MSILAIIGLLLLLWVINIFSNRSSKYEKEKIALFGEYFCRELTPEEAEEWMRRDIEIDKKYGKHVGDNDNNKEPYLSRHRVNNINYKIRKF